MTQKHKPEPATRVPSGKTKSMPGGNRNKWATMGNARTWMMLIQKNPRYARLLFMTRAEDEEFRRTGVIPPPISEKPID